MPLHPKSNQVAIKIVGYKNVKSDREREQLERERNVLLRLKHPNIVNLLKVAQSVLLPHITGR